MTSDKQNPTTQPGTEGKIEFRLIHLKRNRPDVARATKRSAATRPGASANIAKLPEMLRRGQFSVQTQSYHRYFRSMIEKTPRARRISQKELRGRIDRVIAEEERAYGRLIELRDLFRRRHRRAR